MPSPVSGLTSPAASPARSTRPSGCAQRAGDSGRWCPAIRSPRGGPGQQVLQPGDQRRPRRLGPVRREQLPVAHVREPVAAVEGPGVRRRAAGAEGDHLLGFASRDHRRVGAQRQRRRRTPCARARADPGVRAVRADHQPGRDAPVETDTPPPHGDVADPVPEQVRPGVARRVDEPGVEDRARHDPGRPAHGAGDRGPPALEPQTGDRHPVVDHTRDADLGEQVQDVRCDAVTAGLVPGKSDRSSSSTESPGRACRAPSAAAAPAGPAPTTARSQTRGGVHGPTRPS